MSVIQAKNNEGSAVKRNKQQSMSDHKSHCIRTPVIINPVKTQEDAREPIAVTESLFQFVQEPVIPLTESLFSTTNLEEKNTEDTFDENFFDELFFNLDQFYDSLEKLSPHVGGQCVSIREGFS